MVWKALEGFAGFARFCEALDGFERLREALGGFGLSIVCPSPRLLEALGMLSEALGSFDVNTVCPLPGSWINHVAPSCR